MSRLSRKAREARENALKKGLTAALDGDAWLDDEPDLYYALDEIVAGDELLTHLADAVGSARLARGVARDRRRADDRGVAARTDAEEAISTADLRVDDALEAYAAELAETHLDEAAEYIQGDVTLAELEARGDADE